MIQKACRPKGRMAVAVIAAGLLALGLSACEGSKAVYPDRGPGNKKDREMIDPANPPPRDSVFGEGGLDLFGSGGQKKAEGGSAIGVNSFLWRASLDTLGFMPLSSADPFGGVIITEWYSPPESRHERFKANVYVMSRQLRADGVRVAVFRQVQNDKGAWVDADVSKSLSTEMENTILTRARQLRLAVIAD